MSSVDFKTIVRTFQTVFPHTTVWEADLGSDYLLLGSTEHLDMEYEMLRNRLGDERIRADLRKMNITDLASFINKLLMADEAIAQYTKDGPLNTDSNGLLEYSAPLALLEKGSTVLLKELYQYRPNPVSTVRSLGWTEVAAPIENNLSRMFQARKKVLSGFISYAKGAVQDAIKRFEDALVLNPHDYDATYLLAKLNYEIGDRFKDAQRPAEATNPYERSIKAIDNFIKSDGALLSDHFDLELIYAKANLDLGIIALKANRLKEAAEAFQRSLSGEVRYAQVHYNLGIAYERLGKYKAAVNQYQRAIELNPNLALARMNTGNIRLRQKRYREAIESYLQVQKLRPNYAITYYNLGVAYFKQNQWAKAEKEFIRALTLNPDFSKAKRGLELVRNKMKGK
jgi:tetratricopeptide (TPR) repeat protein